MDIINDAVTNYGGSCKGLKQSLDTGNNKAEQFTQTLANAVSGGAGNNSAAPENSEGGTPVAPLSGFVAGSGSGNPAPVNNVNAPIGDLGPNHQILISQAGYDLQKQGLDYFGPNWTGNYGQLDIRNPNVKVGEYAPTAFTNPITGKTQDPGSGWYCYNGASKAFPMNDSDHQRAIDIAASQGIDISNNWKPIDLPTFRYLDSVSKNDSGIYPYASGEKPLSHYTSDSGDVRDLSDFYQDRQAGIVPTLAKDGLIYTDEHGQILPTNPQGGYYYIDKFGKAHVSDAYKDALKNTAPNSQILLYNSQNFGGGYALDKDPTQYLGGPAPTINNANEPYAPFNNMYASGGGASAFGVADAIQQNANATQAENVYSSQLAAYNRQKLEQKK